MNVGKYNYETSFKDAIKQGIDKNEYARESSKNCILTWIANELATANRLKAIELRQNQGIFQEYTNGAFQNVMRNIDL